MANIQLAANLRYLRETHHQSQEELGLILSISRQAYSNYETLNRTPDLDTLIRIAKFYGITLDQLVLYNLEHSDIVEKEKVPHIMALQETSGHSIYLTDEETDLIADFRSLSDNDRSVVTGFAKSRR